MRWQDLSRTLKSPRLLAHTVKQSFYELRHPGEPWLAPGAIGFLDAVLSPHMVALEWGSGRSTAWLARRLAHLVSVEHDGEWHERVRARLAKEGLRNVDLRLFPLPKDRERFDALYWARTDYVYVAEEFADESLDLVIVDGAYRQHCAFLVLSKVKPGGLLLIDDTRPLPRLEDWQIPNNWARVYGPDAGIWSTTIWRNSPNMIARSP